MRKGGGKAKGGAYEHIVAHKLSAAFKPFGIHEDDCYRTKNSGATKSQPGDIQLTPPFVKLLPATIEAKHYKNIKYKIGRTISQQPKSYEIAQWWKQVQREERDAGTKFGLLVMRENQCPDTCAFSLSRLRAFVPDIGFTRYTFDTLIVTRFKQEEIWIVPFADFLQMYCLHLHWFMRVPRKKVT